MSQFRFVRFPLYAVALLMSLGACYTSAPLTTDIPAPATRVIATVTDTGTVAMANKIGPGAREIEGVVAFANSTEWDINLSRVDHRGGTSVLWNGERVKFPRNALTNATVKQMDKNRSWMTGALIGAAAFLAAKAFSGGGATENRPTEPAPPANRVPGSALRFP